MAASVTLNAPTMEGQLYELVQRIQAKERNGEVSATGTNRVTSSNNDDNGTITISATLTYVSSVGADGKVSIEIQEYLTPTL